MNAVRLHAAGDPDGLVYERAPCPRLESGDVLVQVSAAAITPGELAWSATTHDLPRVPAHEFVGRVVDGLDDTGGVEDRERVYALVDFDRDGAAADYVAIAARHVARAPATVDDVHAAAIPLSALTAWQAVFDHGNVGRGDHVLVHGAAGGVGSFAVQLAHDAGARVSAVTSTDDVDLVRALGADDVIDRTRTAFEDVVTGVDLVLDTVGGSTLARSWHVLTPSGTIVSTVEQPSAPGAAWQSRSAVFFVVEPSRPELHRLAGLVDEGRLQALVGAMLPMASAGDAFRHLGAVPGKTVLTSGTG